MASVADGSPGLATSAAYGNAVGDCCDVALDLNPGMTWAAKRANKAGEVRVKST